MAENEVAEEETEEKNYDYIVIGCGSLGYGVVKELYKRNKKVLAIDPSKERVEMLRDEQYDAIQGDAAEKDLYSELDLSNVSSILVLTSNIEVNKNAVESVRKINKDVFLVTRGEDPKSRKELEQAGADYVVIKAEAMRYTVINAVGRIETSRKIKKFKEVLEGVKGKSLAIFTHDNPDPDAISSALALKEIAKHYGVEADIIYFGEIFHQENRAMVNILEIPLKRGNDISLSDYSKFALVDASAPGTNNSIPVNTKMNIVIDHHPASGVETEFRDIREEVGATATIVTEYLKELKISPSRTLATVLFFGLKSETDNFKKNTKTSDFSAAAFLYPFVDNELIEKMEGPAISTETLDILGTAIKNRQVYSSFLISSAGFINDRDALPQAADFLLRLEGISTVLVFGVVKERVYISARNKDVRINIGDILTQIFGEVGSAGGHAHSAGGQIPLGIFGGASDKEAINKLITEAIKKRFLSAVGIELAE
ncbi:MAG: DHH family phosphoesterase [Archaeoglobaceae archaeon]